jgi:hypothetical protein
VKNRVKIFVLLVVIFAVVCRLPAVEAQSGSFIRVNLVGFGPGDIKTAVAFSRDDINDYSTNEPTMDGTAAAILMWAAKN